MDARFTASYSPLVTLKLTAGFFAGALFTSACLLFWVQPLIAKMLLPVLGGAPSVWNACMVFFQALLLAGYGYVLLLSRLRLKAQILFHLALLIFAGAVLPFGLSESLISQLPNESNPTLWLLKVLLITVGLPFFVLSATAPLLQRWFSHSNHSSSKDPYFLYAISNAGSMLSLLAFPFFLEPKWNLGTQSRYWAIGYLILALLIASCALLVGGKQNFKSEATSANASERIPFSSRIQWILLAFIPSSLMLGVTTHIATDVASMPLIWIIPLAIYLLTFILAFANKQVLSLKLVTPLIPAAVIGLGFILILKPSISVWTVIGVHLAVFFLVAFACHRRIALARPAVNKLPEYFLCISIGGVLGGILNALVAPVVFSMPLEYPLIMIAACMVFAAVSRKRLAFALSMFAIMAGGYAFLEPKERSLTTQRNFFGVWRVSADENNEFHRLKHGSTTHGYQFTAPEKRCQPTTYFHNDGPVGQVFQAFNTDPDFKFVGVIGLGAGTLSSYSKGNQQWDYYEIDPAIAGIAQDARYFTYLSDCTKAPTRMILGDARLKMKEAPEAHYDLIVLDAFSSDSIPTHLVTVQAMDMYLSKLAPDGLLAMNVSNRYLNLEGLLSGLVQEKGMFARMRRDPHYDNATAKFASTWVVMARKESTLRSILEDSRWRTLKGKVVWTDDFSNILDLLK